MNTHHCSRRRSSILALILLLSLVLSPCRISAQEAHVPASLQTELSVERSAVLPSISQFN